MVVFQGLNPVSRSMKWSDAFNPLSQAAGHAIGQNVAKNRQDQENIAQGSFLQNVIQEISEKGESATMEDIIRAIATGQQQGLSPASGKNLMDIYSKQIPARAELTSKERIAQGKAQGKMQAPNAASQKWAYEQIDKGNALKQLKGSLNELERLNNLGFTGPVSGRIPSWAASAEADAARKKMVAEGTQILNVHKSMFPRGLTQGEFKDLGQKITNPSNTKEANQAIIDAYRRQAEIQEKKLGAVKQAVDEYGFDPMLPYIVEKLQEKFNDEEEQVNRELYQNVTGKPPMETGMGEGAGQPGEPEVLGRSQSEKPQNAFVKVRHKASGEIADVPREEFYEHPEFEVVGDDTDRERRPLQFGETEEEREERLAELAQMRRRRR